MSIRAAVDIGTNTVRLLIVDEEGRDLERLARVTGLGVGLDSTGELSDEAMRRTTRALGEFRRLVVARGVSSIRVVGTSACRDASNRERFLDLAEMALEIRPEVISGVEEGRLAFIGATESAAGDGPYVVVDIGGGSTEIVTVAGGTSIDVGSVRLTDRLLSNRPVSFDAMEAASNQVDGLLAAIPDYRGEAIGVAGTWASLAAMHLRLPAYDPVAVHGSRIDRNGLDRLVLYLASLTVDEIAGVPSMDPGRAPVILGGSVIARAVMRRLGLETVTVSERDLLDGIVAGLA